METQIINDPGDLPGRQSSGQLQPGTNLVNRYLIQDVVGIGGMGSVYRARDLHFPNVIKLVAVKEMINQAPDPLVRQTIVSNFEREANILATLSHPAIPRIYDYFSLDNRSYLVLEFIGGHDLEVIISQAEGFLPEEQVLAWAIELCDVMSFLHNHKPDPIIFRDLKPSNVMINQHNHVILIDFGIAKVFQSGQKGTMIGTEGYSPPEQYRGEASVQADIYALGASLHHIMTKRDPRLEPPFSFNERPVRKINPNVSAELESVINIALQYTPSDRFKSVEDFKQALIAAGRKTGLLNRINVGPSVIVQGNDIKPLWVFKCEDEIRGTPAYHNGSLFVGCYDNNLYALDAAEGKFQWKYATDGGVVSRPAVFEEALFFGSEDKLVHAVNMRSGKVVWTYATDGRVRSSPRIADGHVFVGSDDRMLHAINLATGRRAWTVDAGGEVRSTPFVTPDLIYFGAESGDFICANFNGNIKWRFKAKRSLTSSPWVYKDTVFVSSVDNHLYALDAKSGWAVWRFRMDKPSISSPAVADDMVFVGCSDAHIYAVDARSSKEVWQFKTEHQVNGSPVLYKDALYCGSIDGNLYCLEYKTGRMRWKFNTKGPITGTPVVYDDIIYVGSNDHLVYALLA